MHPTFLATAVLLLLSSGCATVLDGRPQDVAIRTAPIGATCAVLRGGEILMVIPSTPGSVLVDRGRRDLTVYCSKPGWQPVAFGIASSFTGVTVGNELIGGVSGLVVDAMTGADYRYDENGGIILMSPVLGGGRPGGLSAVPAATASSPVAAVPLPSRAPLGGAAGLGRDRVAQG